MPRDFKEVQKMIIQHLDVNHVIDAIVQQHREGLTIKSTEVPLLEEKIYVSNSIIIVHPHTKIDKGALQVESVELMSKDKKYLESVVEGLAKFLGKKPQIESTSPRHPTLFGASNENSISYFVTIIIDDLKTLCEKLSIDFENFERELHPQINISLENPNKSYTAKLRN